MFCLEIHDFYTKYTSTNNLNYGTSFGTSGKEIQITHCGK